MNVLVVGGGGREHAIIMKLAESQKINKLYCTPGNGGIKKYAQFVLQQKQDNKQLKNYLLIWLLLLRTIH